MMSFKKKFLHKDKKTSQMKNNEAVSTEKNEQNAESTVPVRKISNREIALGYMLW